MARPGALPPPRNRVDDGAALLALIEQWSGGNRRRESLMGSVLFRHPGYVPLLRKRLTVTPAKEEAVRAFMAAFPDAGTVFDVTDDARHARLREWLQGRGLPR